MSTSPQINKQNRPFVGIVMVLDNKKYCIPITSPKDKFKNKKSAVDFIKIFDDKNKEPNGNLKLIGVLNINNMLPIDITVISKIDLNTYPSDTDKEKAYKSLMQKQIKWCRKNYETIQNRATKVYSSVTKTPDKNRNLTRRCCNFAKLEKVLDKYISKNNIPTPNYAYAKIESEQVKDLQLAEIDFEARPADDGKIIVRYNAGDKDRVEQLLAAPPTNGLKLK